MRKPDVVGSISLSQRGNRMPTRKVTRPLTIQGHDVVADDKPTEAYACRECGKATRWAPETGLCGRCDLAREMKS